jgi:glycerophosphoryl diester phosphodiesterase
LHFVRIDRRLGCALAAALTLSPLALRAQSTEGPHELPASVAQSADLAAAMAHYRRALAEYQKAQASYAAAAEAYWTSIADKRHLRTAKRANHEQLSIDDYVLTQPPVYAGPPKPRDPSKPSEEAPPAAAPLVPVVTDFLAAAQQEFKFIPRMPHSEGEFKRAYAKVAVAAGLTKEQIVRIYSFEAGGNGAYDVQAGLEYNKRARAITTALGYNQLLATNTVEIIAESGGQFVKSLLARAASVPDGDRGALENTIAVVRKMIAFARSVPDDWNEHQALANTSKGLAVHALNLDIDVGPFLQTQKLMDSVIFARRKGFSETLTAAELEMMNLTGDGNGFDMITMPQAWRDQVPTANFFQRRGYKDNPVAQRNNVVGKLIAATDARMDQEIKKPGARELAAAL